MKNIIDRFGPLPDTVRSLAETARLRWVAEKLGFEKIILKNESMKCYFISSDNADYFNSDIFGKILAFVQANPQRCKMKEFKSKLILSIEEVREIEDAMEIVKSLSK